MKIKLKLNPEDFIVSEVVKIYPTERGEHSLYLLKKINLTTWDALGKIAKKWHIPLKNFGYGGLKDKRAISYQYITIKGGPKRDLKENNLELTYLGKSPKQIEKGDLLGNNFEIVVREVELEENILIKRVDEVKRYGIPNYFDEQRFGSVTESKEFAVKEIIKGNWERALYLILVESSYEDFSLSQKLRECLRKNWRNPQICLPYARITWIQNLLIFLSEHRYSQRTLKRAINLIDQEYLFFLGNVYQSFLWNEVLKEILRYLHLDHFSIPYPLGNLLFYQVIPEEEVENLLKSLKIPYPSPKISVENFSKLPLRDLYLKVLKNEGFEDFKNLRTFVKGLIFKTYPRQALVFPKDLTLEKISQGTFKIKFFLEKGSYATLVVKRLFYAD